MCPRRNPDSGPVCGSRKKRIRRISSGGKSLLGILAEACAGVTKGFGLGKLYGKRKIEESLYQKNVRLERCTCVVDVNGIRDMKTSSV